MRRPSRRRRPRRRCPASLVRPSPSTAIPPWGPRASPAISASRTSGRTPMAATTSSAGDVAAVGQHDAVLGVTSATPTPVTTRTSLRSNSAATSTAISGSSGVRTWSANSTTVVAIPRWARFSAVSSPTKPAPMTTALRGRVLASPSSSSASSTVRSTRTLSKPGSGGRTGAAPGLSTERVVGQLRRRLGRRRRSGTDGDGVALRVDAHHLGAHPHVEPETLEETLGRLEQQIVLVLDHAADEVGQPAVGIGHVPRAFDHHDGGRLVEASQPGGGRHATGYTTDDDDAANLPLFGHAGAVGSLGAHLHASFMNIFGPLRADTPRPPPARGGPRSRSGRPPPGGTRLLEGLGGGGDLSDHVTALPTLVEHALDSPGAGPPPGAGAVRTSLSTSSGSCMHPIYPHGYPLEAARR